MPSYAENPETGERLVLQGESWVPVQKAVNPTTGETLELFNDQWVPPAQKGQASPPTVVGAPVGGPPATPPSNDANLPQPGTVPPQNETMWQGVKRLVGSAIPEPIQKGAAAAGDAVSGILGDRVADASLPDLVKSQPAAPATPPADKSILAPAKAVLAQQGLGISELVHASLQTSFDTLLKGSILIGKANAKAVDKLNNLFGVSPETQAKQAQVSQISEGQLKGVLAQSQRLYAGVEKKLEAAGAKPSDPAVKATKFLGGTAGTLLKFAALGSAGVAEMTTSSFIDKTYQGIDEGKGWVKSLLAGGTSGGVAASVAAIPGGKEAYGAVWKLLAARGARGVSFGLGFGLSDAAIDKFIYDKKISAQELGDRIGSSIMNMVGLEGAGAIPGIKPIMEARREASSYPSPEAARGDIIRQSGDILNRYADLVGKAESPEAAMASPEAAAMRQEIQALRQKGQAIVYAEKAKIPWTGEIKPEEVANAPEARTQQEGNRPEHRGGDQVGQGNGQVREPARPVEETAPVDQGGGVPIGERPQEGQAKTEEVATSTIVPASLKPDLRSRVTDEASWAVQHRDEVINDYLLKTNVVNGDDLAGMLPSVRANPTEGHLHAAEHGGINLLAADAYARKLSEPPTMDTDGNPKPVLILVGNAAVGKSTLARKYSDSSHVVLDVNSAKAEGLIENINAALRAGHMVDVMYVHAPIEEAVQRNIKRQIDQGRPVPISDQADMGVNVPSSFREAGDIFGADPKVSLMTVETTPEGAKRGTLFGGDALAEADRIREENGKSSLLNRATNAYAEYLGSQNEQPTDQARTIFERGLPPESARQIQERSLAGRGGAPGVVETPAPSIPATPAQAVTPKRTEDIASAIFGGTQVPKVDLEAVRNSVREIFPGKDETSKAIRHALYKREGFLKSNPTSEEIRAAGEQVRNNPLLRRRKEAGAIDLPDVDAAMDGVVKRLFPNREAADPPLTQEQVIQKAREAAKKQVPSVDLSKVNLDEGINGVLADWYLKAHGAGVDENGVPIIGGSLFPAERAAMPTRDATAIEHGMRLIDNPAALWEGGVDTLQDPVFRPGTSPVADAAFANSRAMILKQTLGDWVKTLLAPIPAHDREVERIVTPIFDRYMQKRDRQMALEKQLGRRLEIRTLERDRSDLDAKLRKANQEQTRDIMPPTGVEGGPPAETRADRKASRASKILEIERKIAEIDKKITEIKKDKKGMPILDNPSATMAKYELLETQLERDRKALDVAHAELGAKSGDVRIAVAASLGARAEAYPEWLSKSIRPYEQRIAELTRKFYDDAALPAMEREGIPGRPGENFLHQPTQRLAAAVKGKLGSILDIRRPEHYMEPSLNPESIRFHHKEDNALLWLPSIHASLESYVDTFPSILAKRELANRWDKAVTEMRAGDQPRLAGDVEEFLNNYLHGAKRIPAIDAMMGWFYWKNLALNPSPALLHAVKQFLNWAEVGPIATMKGYKNVAQEALPGEGGHLRREAFKMWMGAKGGVAAIEQGAGIKAPFAKGGAVRKGLRRVGAAPIGQVEAVDRNVTFMGALEMAKAQGLSNEQALQVAMGSTLAINFLGVDRAAMYRGSVGNAVFAFMGAPTKLTDFGRRRAMDVLREFVKAGQGIKSGEGVKGFSPRTGKPWLPEKGPEGESWRKMQAAATYAITIAMADYLGKKLFNTTRLQQGILHLPKLLKLVGAFVTGDTDSIRGATADLAPAITQAMDNIEKYGLGMGLVHTTMPTILDKALRGSPNRKKQPQWGGTDQERATRYLLGTPKADVQERVDRKAAFKKAMQQKRNRETWKREHSWLGRKIAEAVD